jgi:beta-lactamase regulating signal transducer with metallopeptidase domain
MTLSNLFGFLLQYTLLYCLIVAAILALRHPVHKMAGARWAYALWIVLFVPVGFAVAPGLVVAALPVIQLRGEALQYGTTSVAENHVTTSLALLIVTIWLAGIGMKMWRSVRVESRASLALRLKLQPPTADQYGEIERFCRRAGVFPSPEVRLARGISGTAVLGLFKPVLLLPLQFFESFSQSEQELMIRHELAHIQRKDLLWNVFFRALGCVFWFNPLMSLAERRFRLDQELSCDQFVLWEASPAERACYATAILKVSTPRASTRLLEFRSRAPEIIGRTAMIENHRRTVPQLMFGSAVFAMLLVSVSTVSAPAAQTLDYAGPTAGWCAAYRALRQ